MADIREQSPVSNKASAGVKHAGDGMRLAIEFLKDAEAQAKEEAKKGESMKARLVKLTKLTKEEHNAFCAHMNEKREELKQQAKDAGYDTMQKYIESGTKNGAVAASMQATISLWIKMSIACAFGWKPDTKKPWATLSKEATNYKVQKPAGEEKPETDAERKLREAKEQQQTVDKVSRAAAAVLTVGEGADAKMTDIARSALPDVVASVVKWASVEEIDACIKRLSDIRNAMAQAREQAAKAVAKAGQASAGAPAKDENEKAGQSGRGEPAKAGARLEGEHVRTRKIIRRPARA